jgi:alginate O-acetyltransferase complex protein AlgI
VVFSSAAFLFLFLPVFLAVYFVVPRSWRSGWILAGSWIYYGWWRLDFLALLIALSLWAWLVGERIAAGGTVRRWRTAGVMLPLIVLAYFKYFNFGVDSISGLAVALGGTGLSTWRVVLPVGISFYTFQIISYVVDVARGTVPPGRNLVEVAAYISLFPQLVAGPIVRYKEIAHQFRSRDHGLRTFSSGVPRFMIGLARKVLIADAVAPIANAVFATTHPSFMAVWAGSAAFAVQIYFDFAAYSDMAIGLGRMLGFRIPENFNMPYHSRSITEFWRRWHMTLSAWLRDYLYIPLGGNRRGSGRTLVNLMTVMVLGGLWHGAAWTFAVWGAWHGLWLIGERLVLRDRAATARSAVYRVVTIIVVMVSWILFRADGLQSALDLLAGAVGRHGFTLEPVVAWHLTRGPIAALLAGLLICLFEPVLFRLSSGERVAGVRPALVAAVPVTVFLMSLVRIMASSYSPFLYFRF